MKAWIALRLAAVATLLYGAGHTLGAPWTPAACAACAACLG